LILRSLNHLLNKLSNMLPGEVTVITKARERVATSMFQALSFTLPAQ
jgi:hypothetical protein